jgi:hypothetical protein
MLLLSAAIAEMKKHEVPFPSLESYRLFINKPKGAVLYIVSFNKAS